MTEEISEIDCEGLEERQNDLLKALQKTLINVKKDGDDKKQRVYYFETLLDSIETISKEFRENDRDLSINKYPKTNKYYKNDVSEAFGDVYLELICYTKGERDRLFPPKVPEESSSSSPETTQIVHRQIRLDKIQVPNFDGKYTDWPHFRDIYTSLVHGNEDLSLVERFWYLKGCLKGEPYDLVKHMSITNENYLGAWTLLSNHYENPRELFKAQMNLFHGQPKIEKEDFHALRSLLSVSRECRQALENFKLDLQHCDPILIYFIKQKLPSQTIGLWETSQSNVSSLEKFSELESFLETRIRSLEAISESKASYSKVNVSSVMKLKPINYSKNTFHASAGSTGSTELKLKGGKLSCFVCNGNHRAYACSMFLSKSAEARKKFVEEKGLCVNCLSSKHSLSNCTSQRACHCGERHHSLIHFVRVSNHANAAAAVCDNVLLSTAIVHVENSKGELVKLRALLDSGSEVSLISDRAARSLGNSGLDYCPIITGVGGVSAETCDQMMELKVKSLYNDYEILVPVFVLKKLSSVLPSRSIRDHDWPHLQGLTLADPTFFVPEKIDILLGADVYSKVILEGLRKSEGMPSLQSTELGWVVVGAISSNPFPKYSVQSMVTKVEINKLLQKFWEVENLSLVREPTFDENWCEEFFSKTLHRSSSGRYEVRLPFKSYVDKSHTLGKSRQMAISQFVQLERKFQRNSELRVAYTEAFHEYILSKKAELVEVPEDGLVSYRNGDIDVRCCYLPHHAVVKSSSSTTKLRIVFDASRRTSNGKSLNDILYPGPKLHNDLRSIITNWRFHQFAFTADLKQMFLQILVNREDAQYQRVVWRDSPSEPMKEYFLNTVTFGTRSAPWHANRTTKQLAQDYRARYPLAVPFLENSTYVDDVFGGADEITEAVTIQNQLVGIFREGKFHLRKWVSNCDEILQAVPLEDREVSLPLALNFEDSVKTLGIYWQPFEDVFRFQFNLEIFPALNQPLTKRLVLSTIARLHDVLGFISPVILRAKLFMRQLWIDGLDWDDSVSKEFLGLWDDFINDIKLLPRLKIPRWLSTKSNLRVFELHAFCDASKDAYACAIYLRTIDIKGDIHCHLITAKSRPAPVKTLSIPCLELLGAEKLAEAVKKFLIEWKVGILPTVYAWVDSEIVLHWLKGDPHRWDIFVANRVTKITSVIPFEKWCHVASADNPADIASRGCTVVDIEHNSLWWHGPEFLKKDHQFWPRWTPKSVSPGDLNLKPVKIHLAQASDHLKFSIQFIEKFSTYTKLLRTLALIQVLAQRARGGDARLPLSVRDLNSARKFCIRRVQQQFYPKEFMALKSNLEVPRCSNIAKVNPFLGEDDLIRVRGRLEHSALAFGRKFPIILPPKSHFTTLLIRELHRLTLHGGTQLVLTWFHKQYWMIHARKTVRLLILKCTTCFRLRAKGAEQRMGVLPSPRVTISLVFQHTGVDFAGPIDVKVSRFRGKVTYKGYIAIFVCFAVRAIHLELCGDLTTPTFLAALKRFLARRNACTDLYSDNGLTFVGANNLLKTHARVWKSQMECDILPYLINRSISWHFNPPNAPHFGGLWEAGVKSVKFHLKRICKSQSYTFEEWSTFLTDIEGILNSRPLCPTSADPDDLTAITPNHFISGGVIHDLPEPDPTHTLCLPARLSELVKLKNSFWKRWSAEYLNQLQSRPKWVTTSENLKVDDLVLVKQDNIPPINWIMGRVIGLHPGDDGLVRVATLRTKNGQMKRPIAKLCRLPLDPSC